jgi:hypothetical protein
VGSITPSGSEEIVDGIRENGCYRDNDVSCKACSARGTKENERKAAKMKVQNSKRRSAKN